MTDTAKCAGVGCPIRDGCDRFVRPAVDGQRWVEPVWVDYIADFAGIGRLSRCLNHIPLPVQPHGGAREEGDQC
jgi:hypothetical protein